MLLLLLLLLLLHPIAHTASGCLHLHVARRLIIKCFTCPGHYFFISRALSHAMPPCTHKHARKSACACLVVCVCACKCQRTLRARVFNAFAFAVRSLHLVVARASPGLQHAATPSLSCYQLHLSVCSVVFCSCAPAARNKHHACWSQHEQCSSVASHAARVEGQRNLLLLTASLRSWWAVADPACTFRSFFRFLLSNARPAISKMRGLELLINTNCLLCFVEFFSGCGVDM